MNLENFKYQGRTATSEDVAFIKRLIADNPKDSRRTLSKKLCKAWNWVQPNGTFRDMFCRGFLLKLESAGYIELPPKRFKYIVFAKARPIACFSWSSSPRHIGCRDNFIGWSADARKKNLYLIICNSRFLIFNWVRIPHLASHLLATMTKVVPADWQSVYHHGLYFLETFVDTQHFQGTCYQAAGWVRLGVTTGRGKNDQTHQANRSIKAVWGYPVRANFRQVLQHG